MNESSIDQGQLTAVKEKLDKLKEQVNRIIIGQDELIKQLVLSLMVQGHVLIEGVPGLAKTTLIKAFADSLHASFARIQFTPDLLPADIIGTEIYQPKTQDFSVKKGPLFAQLILADEINRAPAKVQSALLEAMQEKQITIGEQTYQLTRPFIVMATQNPIEQVGTYPLPEAQMDRFLFKLVMDYPKVEEEKEIITRFLSSEPIQLNTVFDIKELIEIKQVVESVYIDPKIIDYIIKLVDATRSPNDNDLKNWIEFGASPRASLNLSLASRANALLNGRSFVTPQDIKEVAFPILRHRLLLSFEAQAQNITADQIIEKLLTHVAIA